MQLNAEDGGHRKCILVTNNENNICEDVTYERNKRVINGYTTPKGEDVAGLKNNTLRYYRTDFVGRSRSMKNMRRLMNLSIDMLCIKEDLYTEQTKFGGQQTYKNVFRYFDDGKKRMMIIRRRPCRCWQTLSERPITRGRCVCMCFRQAKTRGKTNLKRYRTKCSFAPCRKPYTTLTSASCHVALEQENNAASNDNKAFNGMFDFDEKGDDQ